VTEEADPVDVEVEKPHVHHPVGEHWLDKVLPISAIFISVVSIWIAYHHGQVMQELVHQNERLVEANSLPYLQVYGSDGPNGAVSLNVANQGVGPAKIATAEISVDGRPVERLNQLLTACCGPGDYSSVSSSTLLGRMLRPGDVVSYVEFREGGADRDEARTFDLARQADRIQTRLCYCSVFDDCWTVTSMDPTPVAVRQCKPGSALYRE